MPDPTPPTPPQNHGNLGQPLHPTHLGLGSIVNTGAALRNEQEKGANEAGQICEYIGRIMDPASQLPPLDQEGSAQSWLSALSPEFSLTMLGLSGTPSWEDLLIGLLNHLATVDFVRMLERSGEIIVAAPRHLGKYLPLMISGNLLATFQRPEFASKLSEFAGASYHTIEKILSADPSEHHGNSQSRMTLLASLLAFPLLDVSRPNAGGDRADEKFKDCLVRCLEKGNPDPEASKYFWRYVLDDLQFFKDGGLLELTQVPKSIAAMLVEQAEKYHLDVPEELR